MYLWPGVLGESVPAYEQVVDVVGGEAVGAGVGFIEPGEQLRELGRGRREGRLENAHFGTLWVNGPI